jgi:hypothetical protein
MSYYSAIEDNELFGYFWGTGSLYKAQLALILRFSWLELEILLSQPLECWNYRCVLPPLVWGEMKF